MFPNIKLHINLDKTTMNAVKDFNQNKNAFIREKEYVVKTFPVFAPQVGRATMHVKE